MNNYIKKGGFIVFEKQLMTADEIFEKVMATMAPLPGQESCARNLASIFSFHLTKMRLMDAGFAADELPQQHAIMVAPTGAGKTYLLKHIAKVCDVNMVFMDGSSMTRDGWKGVSFSQQLWSARNTLRDDEKFARSIVFVDEADKMRIHWDHSAAGNVMDNLLQLFNGGEVTVEIEGRQIETIDVSRFTVIMGGAFAGLEDIIRQRMAPKAGIGFGSASTNTFVDERTILQHVTPEDLQAYGMKKELIARIGSIVSINPLGVEDYRRLLTAGVGSVQANYRNYFTHGFGVDFAISDKAVVRIAEQCAKATTGARAVTPLVNDVLREAISAVGSDKSICKVILTADDGGCYVQYEHGDRGVNGIEQNGLNSRNPYCLSAASVQAVSAKLCRQYRQAGCDSTYAQEFSAFVRLALTYLKTACRGSEFHFANLRKLARAVDKSSKGQMAPFDIIISDNLQIPGHDRHIDTYYREFKKVWTRDTAQRISKALTVIYMRLVARYHSDGITFAVTDEHKAV